MYDDTDEEKSEELFSVHPKLNLLLVTIKHPIQISIVFLILIFMLPEVKWVVGWLTGIGGVMNTILSFLTVFILALGSPILAHWYTYKYTPYKFYDTYFEFTNGIILRETIRISYSAITKMEVRVNFIQKEFDLQNISLLIQKKVGHIKLKKQGYTLQDITLEDSKKISNIIKG